MQGGVISSHGMLCAKQTPGQEAGHSVSRETGQHLYMVRTRAQMWEVG